VQIATFGYGLGVDSCLAFPQPILGVRKKALGVLLFLCPVSGQHHRSHHLENGMNWIAWGIAGIVGVLGLSAFVAALEHCFESTEDA
jgi:hypothetical protein